MMKEYVKTKEQYKDCILFYRLGDFYEMFFEDAKLVSKELELTLTGKDCGLDERAPMCGIPYHAVDGYLNRASERNMAGIPGIFQFPGRKRGSCPLVPAGSRSGITDPRRGSDHYPGKGCPGSCEGKLCGRQCAGGSFPHGSDSGKAGKDGGGSYRSQPFRDPSGTGYSERTGIFCQGQEVYGHRKRCNGKTDGLHAVVRRGRCDRYRASVPEWYCGHSLRLPQDRLQ